MNLPPTSGGTKFTNTCRSNIVPFSYQILFQGVLNSQNTHLYRSNTVPFLCQDLECFKG